MARTSHLASQPHVLVAVVTAFLDHALTPGVALADHIVPCLRQMFASPAFPGPEQVPHARLAA
jgi:hypothetical protein